MIAVALVLCMVPVASMALLPYGQDFEGLNQASSTALSDDGWVVYGNVFGPDWSYWYGYGSYPAPNGSGAFCNVASGEGGGAQGLQQMVVFGDYANAAQADGAAWVQANVYHEQLVGAGDVGETWVFAFDAKMGDLVAPSTALAFIKTLDPNNGYATTNFITEDMTSIANTWGPYSIPITIDAGLVGQLLQFGFACTETNYDPSGVFYDNVVFYRSGEVIGTEDASFGAVKALFR